MPKRLKVLITVKTYPHPSHGHREVVCTAGLLEDGSHVRLYPIDFRYRPYAQWFDKYEWIEVRVEPHRNDPRPESLRPVGEIRTIGKVDTRDEWAERRRIVLAKGVQSMCGLEESSQRQVSLGLVRPRRIAGVEVDEDEREWKPRWKALFKEQHLFGPAQKPLEKIPYKFKYRFFCSEARCKGHTKSVIDWEIGQLYRNARAKHGERVAVDKVREKLTVLASKGFDLHFFVGTVLEHGSWTIVGLFYPPRSSQQRLF